MFEKEFQEWFELNKKWLYSMDHMQAAYSAWCAGVKQQQAVEHTLAPDEGGECRCNAEHAHMTYIPHEEGCPARLRR